MTTPLTLKVDRSSFILEMWTLLKHVNIPVINILLLHSLVYNGLVNT